MAKNIRINDQTFSIFNEEELAVNFVGQCKGYHNTYDSSDSVSSSETYVEETTFSVSGGEEVKQWVGEEYRSKGEVEGAEVVEGGE